MNLFKTKTKANTELSGRGNFEINKGYVFGYIVNKVVGQQSINALGNNILCAGAQNECINNEIIISLVKVWGISELGTKSRFPWRWLRKDVNAVQPHC